MGAKKNDIRVRGTILDEGEHFTFRWHSFIVNEDLLVLLRRDTGSICPLTFTLLCVF